MGVRFTEVRTEAMVNSSYNRYFLAILIVLSLAAAIPLAGVVRADHDVSRGPDDRQLSAGEEGTYRVQVAAYFSSRRAKKAKKKDREGRAIQGSEVGHRIQRQERCLPGGGGRVPYHAARPRRSRRMFVEAGYEDAEVVVDHRYRSGADQRSFRSSRPIPRGTRGVAAPVETAAAPTGPEWTSKSSRGNR